MPSSADARCAAEGGDDGACVEDGGRASAPKPSADAAAGCERTSDCRDAAFGDSAGLLTGMAAAC